MLRIALYRAKAVLLLADYRLLDGTEVNQRDKRSGCFLYTPTYVKTYGLENQERTSVKIIICLVSGSHTGAEPSSR